MESVAVADVPDAPLSTIIRAGVIPLAEPLTAQFTLTLLLLKHLQGDGSQFGIRRKDAVLVKGRFVHGHKLDQVRAEVNRRRTVSRLSHAVKHFGNRLLILLIGGEAITEPSGNLTNGTVDGVATLLDHLQAVRVLCFVHASTIHGIGLCAHFVCHLSDCPRAAALSNI